MRSSGLLQPFLLSLSLFNASLGFDGTGTLQCEESSTLLSKLSGEKKSIHGDTRGGNLTVTVVEATGIRESDGAGPFGGPPDVVVELEVISTKTKRRTGAVESTEPRWEEDLVFGAQAAGAELRIVVYDYDTGFELGDDVLYNKTHHVIDCACFEETLTVDSKVVCTKPACIEDAWIPLDDNADCSGRETCPWKNDNTIGACLRLRMTVIPFRVSAWSGAGVQKREFPITTASRSPTESDDSFFGSVFTDVNLAIEQSGSSFDAAKGGLLVQMITGEANANSPNPFMELRTNYDADLYLFRHPSDAQYKLRWVEESGIWSDSSVAFSYNEAKWPSMKTFLPANTTINLGPPKDLATSEDEVRLWNPYVPVLVMREHTDERQSYYGSFDKSTFFPILFEMIIATLPFVLVQARFLRRIGWRLDRIESGVLNGASRDEKENLIALVFKPIYQNGSKANIDFQRNLYFVSLGTKIVLAVPLASVLSFSFGMSYRAIPVAAGTSVLCIGLAVSVIVYNFTAWESSGWRMSKTRLYGFAAGFTSLFMFLFSAVAYDMRVLVGGLPYSIFGLSCVGFTLNAIPMVAIFFLDNDQMYQSFNQLQKVIAKNAKMNSVKNKFQALGTMGLKMALLSNKMREQQKAELKEKESTKQKPKASEMPFGSLLGSIYTVDDTIQGFEYSDVFRRWFTGGKKKRKLLVRRAYSLALLVLLTYSLLVYSWCDTRYRGQGFGLSFTILVMDACLFAILRGPCMWETSHYVALSFAGRAVLAFFAGEQWLVGVGLAYFLFGTALGVEIINQRMRTISSNRAGAIAYFGLGLGKKKRKNDVSAMPEFVLASLSFFFLVALLGYMFTVDAADIPTVQIAGQEWKVWIFGVAAFVIVTVSVVLGLARRAIMLQREGLLHSKTYFVYKWFNLPLQLVALAELLVVMSGLLIYAMTSSTFVFVSAVFWPLIIGACVKIYTHWKANDYNVFQSAEKRVPTTDPGEDSSDEEDEYDGEQDDQDDGYKDSKKRKGHDDDEDDDDDDDDEEEEDEDGGALGGIRRSLFANIEKFNEKFTPALKNGEKKSRIGLPNLAFRKPMNLAQKVDRDYEEDESEDKSHGADETEQVGDEENKSGNEPDGEDQNCEGAKKDDPEKADDPTQGEPAANPQEEGEQSQEPKEEGGQEMEVQQALVAEEENKLEDQETSKSTEENKVQEEETKKTTDEKEKKPSFKVRLVAALKNASLANMKKGIQEKWATIKAGWQSRKERVREKVEPKVKKWLEITEETDPVKMTAMEAFWNGKLTPIDYSMLRAMGLTSGLVTLYGITLALTEQKAAWGGGIIFAFLLGVFIFMPVRKFHGTQTVTGDMVRCLKVSVFLEVLGSIVLFSTALGGSLSHPGTLWLLLGLALWPATLYSLTSLVIWADSDWKISQDTFQRLEKCFGLFLFSAVLSFFYIGAQGGFLLLMSTVLLYTGVQLADVWSKNGFYLPHRHQLVLNSVLTVCAIFFGALTLVLASDSQIFFTVSLAFGSVLTRMGANFVRLYSTAASDGELFFSTFIFPIYSLDAVHNDLIDQSHLGVLMYKIQLVVLLWGAACIILVDPLEIGVGIVSFAFVCMVTLTCYLASRTPVWLAGATLCVDEKELKKAAKQAREVFETRRKNFEIVCDEYEKRDEEDARMQRALNKYAAWNTKRTRVLEFEKRFSAKEMIDVVSKAEKKLLYDRLGKLRKDRELGLKTGLSDALHTGKGPFAPLFLGGLLRVVYDMYKHPAKSRKKRAKSTKFKRGRAKVYAEGNVPGSGGDKFILDGPAVYDVNDSDDEEEEGESGQLERLVDELGPGGDVLKIHVKDWDLTSANDDLGFVEIDLDELEPEKIHIDWYELESDPKKAETKEAATGKIQVQIEIANLYGEENLQVRVIVLRAKGLRAADKGGTSDPFCIVECGAFSRRTPVVFKTLDPDWTETRGGGRFTFPPVDDTLQIEVRDKDLFTSDFLGGVDIYLPDLEPGVEVVETYQLEGGYGKTRAQGEVKLALLLSSQVNEYGLIASRASLQVTVISAKGLRAADKGGTSDPFCVAKCGMDAFSTSVIQKTLDPKWLESYTFNAELKDPNADEEEEDLENVEMFDCWKVYQQLPRLDAALSREYYEESRANALFQMLVVVASEGRKSKEAILFQRFLREFRFKLLANKIEPPKSIFRSKSWATVDVELVALWLLRLTPEQRDRFYALKRVFTKEVERIEEQRLNEDAELAAHSQSLEAWQRQFDQERGRQQLIEFERRRERRKAALEAGGPGAEKIQSLGLHDEPELVINAREMLQEISEGKNTVMIKMDEDDEDPTRVFQDPEFPAGPASTAGMYNEAMVVGWKRGPQINDQVKLFSGGTDPDDVFQGVLYNGWFLSAVAILAASGSVGDDEVDPLIDNLFITKSINDVGAYAVRLYKNSQWELVLVDDSFPMLHEHYKTEKNAGVACSYSLKFEEMWVSILEKAYAKYYGTYAMLENGYVHHALKTLTGFHAEEVFLLNASEGPARARLWERMVRYARNGFLMGCGTIANNAANAELLDSGLVFGQVYAIYQVRKVDSHCLLQLRNPPSASSEWKGDWGDKSPLWTTRLKKKLGWTEDEDDGTFWMSFSDFLLSFRSLYICHYYDPRIWKHVTLRGRWSKEEKTAGGLPSKHNPDCKLQRNPQWVLDIQRPVDVHIKVSQTEEDGTMVATPQPFTALLLRTNATRLRHVHRASFLSQKILLGWTENPDRAYEKHLDVTVTEPGYYILLVATYDKDQEGPFQVRIDSSFEVSVSQLFPRPKEAEVEIQKTETVIKQVDPPKTRMQRIKRRLHGKMAKVSKNLEEKWAKVEVKLEEKVDKLDALMKKHLDIDIKTAMALLRDEEIDSDDDGEENAVVAAFKKSRASDAGAGGLDDGGAATAQEIQDIMTMKTEYPLKSKKEEDEDDDEKGEDEEEEKEEELTALQIPPAPESDWVKQYDPNSQQHYYWNKVTGESTWDRPEGFESARAAVSPEMQSATKIQSLFRARQSRRDISDNS